MLKQTIAIIWLAPGFVLGAFVASLIGIAFQPAPTVAQCAGWEHVAARKQN